MTLTPLTLIPAGAGSGKTYMIQTKVRDWIARKLVSPDRIVAVTFTEAAAAELRDRLRAELVRAKHLEDALLLDQAYITTIHGFGLRLISEFAFEAGQAPKSRLLNKDEEKTLIRMALARTERADRVIGDLRRFGYGYDFSSGKGPEDGFRDRILSVIGNLRAIGRLEEEPELASYASRYLKDRYGPTETANGLNDALSVAVGSLLASFPDDLSGAFGSNDTAKKDLRRDRQNLGRAQNKVWLENDWKLWSDLRKLRLSRQGNPMPDGYDSLGQAVIDAADLLPRHPGPLADSIAHAEALLGAAQEALDHYAEMKQRSALVDFTDMLAVAQRILVSRPGVLEALHRNVDCMVIDEFQDTNPLQFSLLWAFKEAGVPTLIVGDVKQAIMGFQGADPRLMEKLLADHSDHTEVLDANWRTQPSLMPFVNAVSRGLFRDKYTDLKPRADEGFQKPLEVIDYPKLPPRGKAYNEVRAMHTALRIKELLDDEEQFVQDRRTKAKRRLRGADVAILCPSHKLLGIYAEALRLQGLRAQLSESGWHESRIVTLVRHAIEYVVDPTDLHAALYLSVTELGSNNLEQALTAIMDDGRIDDDLLKALDAVAVGPADRTVDGIVAEVISALDLFGIIAGWRDASQARANLLRFQAEAREFVAANPEALASGGYFGSGAKVFLAWLEAKVDGERDADRQPDARVRDEDAVQLATWHSAKGREWPIVAVCGWEDTVSPRLPDLSVEYTDFLDLGKILENARIVFIPNFVAAETRERFLADMQKQAETEAHRLIYVALTRPREKLILEWPSHLDPKLDEGKTVTYYSLLRGVAHVTLGNNGLTIGDQDFPCRIGLAANEMPDDLARNGGGERSVPLPVVGRRAVGVRQYDGLVTPEFITPSGLEGTAVQDVPEPVEYAYGSPLDIDLQFHGASRGTFLHRCFEILGKNQECPDLIERATGVVLSDEQLASIADAVGRFETWLSGKLQAISIGREVAFLVPDHEGSVVPGTIDLLVETSDGYWIIDHKSDQTDDLDAAFRHYWPQLQSYFQAVNKALEGKKIVGVGINWITHGTVWTTPK
jgi:ATP-dependent helicase/nuclease subunit A